MAGAGADAMAVGARDGALTTCSGGVTGSLAVTASVSVVGCGGGGAATVPPPPHAERISSAEVPLAVARASAERWTISAGTPIASAAVLSSLIFRALGHKDLLWDHASGRDGPEYNTCVGELTQK